MATTGCASIRRTTRARAVRLPALLVIDRFGAGYVVGHMITTRQESEAVVGLFYQKIKAKLSVELKTKWFMSDDKEFFGRAFTQVFSCSPTCLLCHWHIKRSWGRNLKKIKGGREKQKLAYQCTRHVSYRPCSTLSKFGSVV